MTPLDFGLIMASQVFLVAGQLWTKHAMNITHRQPVPWGSFSWNFVAGLAASTLWFLLWIGLLQKLDLSYLFPFEGISPALMVVAASLFLREKMTLRLWLGVILIAGGVALVAGS